MHIAYITHEYPPDTGKGGIATYTRQIASIMAQLGHTVEVFTASHTRTESNSENKVMVHRLKMEQMNLFAEKILPLFIKRHQLIKFDIIESPEIGAEAWFIKEKYPEIPLIVRLHTPAVVVTRMQNSYLPFSQKMRYVLGAFKRGKWDLGYWSRHDKNQYKDKDYLITQKANIITAPSQFMKNWAIRFWNIKPERIVVLPNPYHVSSELLQISANTCTKRITFMGRLNVLKGCVSLTHAMKKVLKKYPDWHFRIIGNTEQSHIPNVSMKQWMQTELQYFSTSIEFIDWIDYKQIPKYLSETDIMVIPSLFESFSYVCAEAMSAARAIVGSNNTAMRELLSDGECGILVNPYNDKKIANAIIKFIENRQLRIELGKKARLRILNTYNPKIMGEKFEKLYQNYL